MHTIAEGKYTITFAKLSILTFVSRKKWTTNRVLHFPPGFVSKLWLNWSTFFVTHFESNQRYWFTLLSTIFFFFFLTLLIYCSFLLFFFLRTKFCKFGDPAILVWSEVRNTKKKQKTEICTFTSCRGVCKVFNCWRSCLWTIALCRNTSWEFQTSP